MISTKRSSGYSSSIVAFRSTRDHCSFVARAANSQQPSVTVEKESAHRDVELRVGGHHDHLGVDAQVARLAQHLAPVEPRHLQVEQHDVHVGLLEHGDAFLTSRSLGHSITGAGQLLAHEGAEVGIIVDDENGGGRRHRLPIS